MSINLYSFDNANDDGDKEAVVVPNVPTLINKLSANEANGIKDKINEVVTLVNSKLTPVLFLELRLKFKGEGNTLDTLQVGDIVHGFKEDGVIWDNAIYEGGDITDRDNYTPILNDEYLTKTIYDPTNKQADAFSMTNMVEGVVNKILTNAAQTIGGVKTFTSPLHINNVDEAFIQLTQDTATASLSAGAIVFNSNAKEIEVSQSSNQVVSSVQVKLPITSGTLALTSDIPTNSNYVDLTTAQTIGGVKTLNETPIVNKLITITDKNQYYDIIKNGEGISIIRNQSKYWDGTSFVNSNNGIFLGHSSGIYNIGNNIGLISGYLAGKDNKGNNIGLISGDFAGSSNTGNNIGLISGSAAGYYNKGNYIGLISGYNAGKNNKGNTIGLISGDNAGFNNIGNNIGLISGFNAGDNNTGKFIGIISGDFAGSSNTGNYIGIISGFNAGYNNIGGNIGLISGFNAGYNNIGNQIVAIGDNSLKYNQKNKNTAVGDNTYSQFLEDVANNKSFDYSAINASTDRVTINAHGFGSTGEWVNVRYKQGTSSISGLSNNIIYQIKIIDANTISFRELIAGSIYHGISITNAGTGTGHILTPQFAFENVTVIGANAQPTKDNQVVLGDENVDEVIAGGKKLAFEEDSNAYADGIVEAEEQARINADTLALATAEAKAKQLDDAIKIGGRNYYLRNNNYSIDEAITAFTQDTSETPYGFFAIGSLDSKSKARILGVITENGNWTVSFDIRGAQDAAVFIQVDVCDIGLTTFYTNNDNSWKRVSMTVNVDNYSNVNSFVDFTFLYAYFYVRNLKVEKGTKATDWSPAPEDTLLKGTNGRYNLGTATYFADNAAAITGGLVVGDMYVTPTGENRTVV